MSDANLITSYLFNGNEYLTKMNVTHNYLEISITDKQSGEEWQCSYDQAYIENLTHKTGNFKHFDVFVAMLRSGLLKTSDCIGLDLLTYDDLEALRVRRIRSNSSKHHRNNKEQNNRRYLILIYDVEFDRILYPLPLEYCGPPDPAILQGTIKKLNSELDRTRHELEIKWNNSNAKQISVMQRRIDDLVAENSCLRADLHEATKARGSKIELLKLQSALTHLEKSVLSERRSHHQLVEKMKQEKMKMTRELEKLRAESAQWNKFKSQKTPPRYKSNEFISNASSIKEIYKNSKYFNKKAHTTPRSPVRNRSKECTNNSSELTRPRSQNHMKSRSSSPWSKHSDEGKQNNRHAYRNNSNERLNRRCNSSPGTKHSEDEGKHAYCNNSNDRLNHCCNSSPGTKHSEDEEKHVHRNNSKDRLNHRSSSIDRISNTSSSSGRYSPRYWRSRSTQFLQMKLKNSEDDYVELEKRICSIQRMLKDNVNL